MIAQWFWYASVVGCVIAFVAFLLERIMQWRNWSTRWIWLVAVVVIVALPILLNLLATPTPPRYRETYLSAPSASAPSHSFDTPLLIGWLLGSLLLATRVCGAGLALRGRRKTWEDAELDGKPVLIADTLGPAVIGWAKFTTVIPRWALTLDAPSRALMLQHEAEHVRSGDPYLRMIALAALVLMPWNPALWWSMRRMRLAVEIDCDRRLLVRGVDPHLYASLLLTVGERIATTPFAWATALAGSRSTLQERIIAMVSPVRPRHPRLAMVGLSAVIVAVVVIACDSSVPNPILPLAASSVGPDSSYRIYRGTDGADTVSAGAAAPLVCGIGAGCTDEIGYVAYRGRDSGATSMAKGSMRTAAQPGSPVLAPLPKDSEMPTCTPAMLEARRRGLAGEIQYWPRCYP